MSSKLESDMCCRLQVAPSGESYEGKRMPVRKQWQTILLGIWRDSLHVTCGLTVCTPGSAPGPTLGNEYGKTFYFTFYCIMTYSCFQFSTNRSLQWSRLWHCLLSRLRRPFPLPLSRFRHSLRYIPPTSKQQQRQQWRHNNVHYDIMHDSVTYRRHYGRTDGIAVEHPTEFFFK